MNCEQFLQWMKTHAGQGKLENPEVMAHLRACPACRQLFYVDACLEAGIQQAFTPHRVPAGLVEAIDACVDRYSSTQKKFDPPDHDPTSVPETDTPVLQNKPLKKNRVIKDVSRTQHKH